jgi:rhodanese-related sulfurtransferase
MSDEAGDEEESPHAIAPQRAAELIAAGATLVDVRRPYEYEGGHLEGAVNIEMNELPARSGEIPRDRPVLFYCRTGNRSGMAVDAFREAGYQAHNLAGGITAWHAEGRALDPEDGEVRAPLPAS